MPDVLFTISLQDNKANLIKQVLFPAHGHHLFWSLSITSLNSNHYFQFILYAVIGGLRHFWIKTEVPARNKGAPPLAG